MDTADKGRDGELRFNEILIKLARFGAVQDYKKPTFTNEPDDGKDFELKAPHNISEIMESLKKGESKTPPFSNQSINIRVDVKNYSGKIGKPVVDKFVGDIKKNPNDNEHWLVGGVDLTKPAQNALEYASAPCRYYSQGDLNRIDNTLSR